MAYLSLLVGLLGLAVALSSFVWSWWLNRRVIDVTFKWVMSTNDDSLKLAISLSNLSPRTTMITKLFLKSGVTIINDNGYNYVAAETHSRNSLSPKNNIESLEIDNWNIFKEEKPVIPDIQQLHPDSPRSDSKNFLGSEPLFGNNSLHYTYWIDPTPVPEFLSITSSNFINGLHKTVSFKIPAVPNEVKQSSDIKNEGN